MSLRPAISGFRLETMQKLFTADNGVDTDSLFIALEESATEHLGEDSKEQEKIVSKGKEVILRAVQDGIPFAELDSEEISHVMAADVLAHFGQDHHEIDDTTDWKMDVFWDLEEKYGADLDPSTKKLLHCISEGRPLFGKRIDSDWSYYAYLSCAEVMQLHSALHDLQKKRPELSGDECFDGFVDELLAWLSEIAEQNLDMWCFMS